MEFSESSYFLRLFVFLLVSFPHSHGWHQFSTARKQPRLSKHHRKIFHSATEQRYKKSDLKFLPTHSGPFRTNHQRASNQELLNAACNSSNDDDDDDDDDENCNPILGAFDTTRKLRRPLLKRSSPFFPIVVSAATLRPIPALATTIHPANAYAAVPIMTCPVSAATEYRLMIRLVIAALIGAALGKERSFTKHSAGVRTMSLVSLGAAVFTVCSGYGFANFPKVDASRMAANVASGVGFVGAGVITTSMRDEDKKNPRNLPNNTVHGLTTAATIWLSAAVGVACGVGLLRVATTAAFSTLFILRMGRKKKKLSPRITYPPIPKQHRLQLLGNNEDNLENVNSEDDDEEDDEIYTSIEKENHRHHDPDQVYSNMTSHEPELSQAYDQLIAEERSIEVEDDPVHTMKNHSSISVDELSSKVMEEIVRSAWKNDKELVTALVDRVLNQAEQSDHITERNSNSRKGNPTSSDSEYLP